MNRKDFIRQCGFACLGVAGLSTLIESCTTTKQVQTSIVDNKLQIPLTAFIASSDNSQEKYKRYVIAHHESLNYPIVVYRNTANDYTALLLRCSHLYNELSVNGELLSCSAHGSEFNTRGEVVTGPAEDKLRSFPVTIDAQNLLIHLV